MKRGRIGVQSGLACSDDPLAAAAAAPVVGRQEADREARHLAPAARAVVTVGRLNPPEHLLPRGQWPAGILDAEGVVGGDHARVPEIGSARLEQAGIACHEHAGARLLLGPLLRPHDPGEPGRCCAHAHRISEPLTPQLRHRKALLGPRLAAVCHRHGAHQLHADRIGGFHLGGNRSVGLPLMSHVDRAVGRGITALGPGEVAQIGRDPHPCKARLQRRDPEHMPAEPRSRPAGPAVAEAVAEAFVAVVAEVAVDVGLALGHELVDRCCVFRPGEVEVFPERGRPHVEHAAPVAADQLQGGFGLARLGQGLEHIEAVESRHAAGPARQQHLASGRLRIPHAGQDLQARA